MTDRHVASGVHLPHYGRQWRDLDLAGSARLLEELGFGSVWLSDHVVLAEDPVSRYPFSVDGVFSQPPDQDWLDWATTAAFLAARTTTLEIGVGVAILPLRHPLLLAKQVATLDQLSDGRIRLGVGAGWLAEEFDALGVDFAARGQAMDGGLRLLREAWTGQPAPGRYGPYTVPPGIHCRPTPQRPRVPVYLGGGTAPAFRRVAQYGDGWYGSAAGGRMEPAVLASAVAAIRTECARIPRDPDEIDIALRYAVAQRELGTEALRSALVDLVRAGATRFSFDVGWRAPDEMGARLEALARTFDEVLDAVG